MALKAAEILATALERDAEAQDAGELGDLRPRIEAVRQQVLPINDIPRPVFKLAQRFYRDWAMAAANDWRYRAPIDKSEWPRMARVIAQSVRSGRLPNDRPIIDYFVRRRIPLPWRELKKLFDRGDRGGEPDGDKENDGS